MERETTLISTPSKLWLSFFWGLIALQPTFSHAFPSVEHCVLTMGYRTSERLPFIEAEPNDGGIYQDIYRVAAQKIGCKLKVVRAPKLRILRDLRLGNIDFYPGLSFTQERAQYATFIPNGLSERDIGITRAGAADLLSIEQLIQSGMILLIAPGGYDFGGLIHRMPTRKPPELNVPNALNFILSGQGDLFIYDQTTLGYYLKNRDKTQFKLHYHCCDVPKAMYLGFSRKSRHYRAQQNPNFNADHPISPDNSPTMLDPNSKAYEFAKVLAAMDANGDTQQIYARYLVD